MCGYVWLMMVQVVEGQFSFLKKAAQEGKVSQSAVESFIPATATLLQQMLMSKSPIIPWTGLTTYDPLYVDVHARQLSGQSDAVCEDDFRGWLIVGYKRPVLLSCSHGQVKIDRGTVRLKAPNK